MKQNLINKMLSIFAVLVLVGSVSAASADLSGFPDNFKKDGDFNGKLVIGGDARPTDSIGALFLADSLRSNKVEVFETLGKVVKEDIPIGSSLIASNKISQELTDSDLDGLLDTKINFQSSDYDISEVVILGQNGNKIGIESSLTSDEDYETEIKLEVARDAIKYFYRFDESIDLEDVTTSEPLSITVLGQKIKIIDIDSDTKLTAFVGQEYFLGVGDVIVVDDKTVKLMGVGSGDSIVIEVDGEIETIPGGNTENVNGIEVHNEETFYTNEVEGRRASLIIGKSAVETYSDGDAFIGQDETDPEWVWNLGNLKTTGVSNPGTSNDGTGPFIGVENDFVINDDSDNPASVGEEIVLPFNYLKIRLNELTVSDEDYQTYTFEYDNSADLSDALGNAFSGVNAVYISTTEDEGLIVKSSLSTPSITSDVKTQKIWLYGEDSDNLDVLYEDDDDNKVKLAGKIDKDSTLTFAQVNYGNTKGSDVVLKANFSPSNSKLDITLSPSTSDVSNDDIVMEFGLNGNDVKGLGSLTSQEEASELEWNGNTIGTKDEDLRSKYGIIIRDPQNNGNSDEVVVEIPEDEVQVGVIISGQEGVIVNKVVVSDKVPKIELDSEVLEGSDMILIGGPAVNTKTAELLGVSYPSFGTSDAFPVGERQAMVKLVERDGVNYLIIAGYEANDTRSAIDLMINFDDNRELFLGKTETVINLF